MVYSAPLHRTPYSPYESQVSLMVRHMRALSWVTCPREGKELAVLVVCVAQHTSTATPG